MTTWTALTTLKGSDAAYALQEDIENLNPEPTAVGVLEIEDGSGLWEVGAYFVEEPDKVALDLLAAVHGAQPFVHSVLEDQDWMAQVKRELTPVIAGRFAVFGAHDRDQIPDDKIKLEIEAAMAFGTGHHGTTKGCLLAIDALVDEGFVPAVSADIGCGTGVLGMAAAAVWKKTVIATDIDPTATAVATTNAKANGVDAWMKVGTAVGFQSELHRDNAPYDLVLANILARPLRGLAYDMFDHMNKGGIAVLSGILNEQSDWVEEAYIEAGFTRKDRLEQQEWTTLVLIRG